jgi:hypothetical protein
LIHRRKELPLGGNHRADSAPWGFRFSLGQPENREIDIMEHEVGGMITKENKGKLEELFDQFTYMEVVIIKL